MTYRTFILTTNIYLTKKGEYIELRDHTNNRQVKLTNKLIEDLIIYLQDHLDRPKEPYYLWKGTNGTIISGLTKESDLPSITIGGGGKREKFEPISQTFFKDKYGNFKQGDK